MNKPVLSAQTSELRSRSRFWGVPLPIWRTDDGEQERCIGSIEELAKAIDDANEALGLKQYVPADLHRPFIDEIVLVSHDLLASRVLASRVLAGRGLAGRLLAGRLLAGLPGCYQARVLPGRGVIGGAYMGSAQKGSQLF